MNKKPANILATLGLINFIVFYANRTFLAASSSSGPEGIGTALIVYACLGFSILLTGFGLNELAKEKTDKTAVRRIFLASLIGALPLLVYFFADVLPFRHKTAY